MSAEFRWLEAQLSRFTYKPGWTLRLEPSGDNSYFPLSVATLRIEFRTTDAYDPSRLCDVISRVLVPSVVAELKDEWHFAQWLQHSLMDVEYHESREWLRRDGEIYDNPHQKEKP